MSALKVETHLRYFHEISHKCKTLWDHVQITRTITLVNLPLELQPFEHRKYWRCPFLPCTGFRSVSWKLFQIFWWNFTQIRWRAELMNHNSGLPSFGVIGLWALNISISAMYLCPLCKLKTIWFFFFHEISPMRGYTEHKKLSSG